MANYKVIDFKNLVGVQDSDSNVHELHNIIERYDLVIVTQNDGYDFELDEKNKLACVPGKAPRRLVLADKKGNFFMLASDTIVLRSKDTSAGLVAAIKWLKENHRYILMPVDNAALAIIDTADFSVDIYDHDGHKIKRSCAVVADSMSDAVLNFVGYVNGQFDSQYLLIDDPDLNGCYVMVGNRKYWCLSSGDGFAMNEIDEEIPPINANIMYVV